MATLAAAAAAGEATDGDAREVVDAASLVYCVEKTTRKHSGAK